MAPILSQRAKKAARQKRELAGTLRVQFLSDSQEGEVALENEGSIEAAISFLLSPFPEKLEDIGRTEEPVMHKSTQRSQ